MVIQEDVQHDKVEERVGDQSRKHAGVSPISILVVGVVPVDGTQAADHLPEARQECHLHEEVVRQELEDEPVEEENATHVEEVEHEKAAMCKQEDIVPADSPIWRCLWIPFGGNPNDRIVGVSHCYLLCRASIIVHKSLVEFN
jgi:hypothetical protein